MGLLKQMRGLSAMGKRLVLIKFLTYVGMIASYYIGVLGTLTYAAGGDALASSLAVGILNASMVVGVFVGGSVVDAWGPRRHLAFTVGCACTASIVFILLSGSVAGILAGCAFFGFAWGTADPVFRAYPAYLTDDLDELKTVNAALNTAISVGVIVGPIVGSAISLVAPTRAVLLFAVACSLLALVPGSRFQPARDPRAEDGRSSGEGGEGAAANGATDASAPSRDDAGRLRSAFAGFETVAANPTLRLLVTAGFLAFFAYGAFDPLEALYYRDVLHAGVEWMGVLSSASGVGAVVGGLAVLRLPQRHVNMRTFMWLLVLCGVACVVYTGTSNLYVALAGQVLVGFANGAFNPLQSTLVQVHAPLREVGRVSAAIGFGYTVSGVVPLFLAPWLAEAIGVQPTLVASGACVVVVTLALMLALRRRIGESVEAERALCERSPR